MAAGDTFRLVGVADRHTWVILSDPAIDAARVLLVSFTGYVPGMDPSCIVEVEELSILDKRSCIYYADIKEASVAALDQLQAAGKLQKRTPVSQQLLARIRGGVSLSRDIEVKYIEFLLGQGVIE
jgi:hypothetical protein